MIKYTTSQFNEPELPTDVITGYMVELRNEYGNISCRTILNLPEGEKDIRLWFYDSVIAIPDLKICFKIPGSLSYAGIIDVVSKESTFGFVMASALAATVMIMDLVVSRECEHWDMSVNLAEHINSAENYYINESDEDFPF